MPNILIEAMSAGLPIASSYYHPMPEFIQDAAEYFEPTSVADTEQVLELLIKNPVRRLEIAERAYQLATEFSWKKCSNETFDFLEEIVNRYTNK